MKIYDIAFKSEKGRKKESYEQNGDYCAWLETDHWVVATLADGVGSYSNDFEASETSCKMFLEKCRQHLLESQTIDEKTMCSFCEEIDPILAKKKEMSCFSAVAWRTDEERAIWLNIGDTRIYRYGFQSGLKQITVDDHGKAVVRRVNGKVYTDHGSVVTAIPISRAIGDTKLEFHTGAIDFRPGENLVLCCDGMYDTATFEEDVKTALESSNLAEATSRIPHTDDDDASILLLRRLDGYEQAWSIESLTEEINAEKKSIPRSILLRKIEEILTNSISTKGKEESLAALIKLCREKGLFLSHEKTSEILNSVIARYRALAPDDPSKAAVERMAIQLQYYAADTPK